MMNREDIINMALEAGFNKDSSGLYFHGRDLADSDLTPSLERFAALVADAARGDYHEGWEEGYKAALRECAELAEKAEPFTAADLIEAKLRGVTA